MFSSRVRLGTDVVGRIVSLIARFVPRGFHRGLFPRARSVGASMAHSLSVSRAAEKMMGSEEQ